MIASLAFRNVLRNKERSLLTLVGVVLAIGSLVALVSLAAGFTRRVESELGSREVHIYVVGARASNLPVSPLAGSGASGVSLPKELQEILQVEGVSSVTPVIRSSLDTPRSVVPVLALPFDKVPIVFREGRFGKPPRDLEAKPPIQEPTSTLGEKSAVDPQRSPKPWVTPKAKATPTPTKSPTPTNTTPTPTPSSSPALKTSPSPLPPPVPQNLPSAGMQSPTIHHYAVHPVLVGQGLERDLEGLLVEGNLIIEELPFYKASNMGSRGFLDYSVLAPIEAFFEQRPDRGVHEFWLTVLDEKNLDSIQSRLQARVDAYLSEKESVGDYAGARRIEVLTRYEYLRSAKEYLSYGWLLQFAVSMVGVLIAVAASMNTMLMSTYERLGEYATMRAVGASRRTISLTIIFEAIFLNVTGGVIGMLFGYLATGVLDKAVALVLEIPYPMAGVTPGLLLQALFLSFAVGVIGALLPCVIVNRIDLVEQLRKGM